MEAFDDFTLLSPEQAWKVLHLKSENVLRGWILRGVGPKPIRVGGRLYFSFGIIRDWLEAQREVTNAKVSKNPQGAWTMYRPQERDVLRSPVEARSRGVVQINSRNQLRKG